MQKSYLGIVLDLGYIAIHNNQSYFHPGKNIVLARQDLKP
jgi:hypothetical protein